LLAINDIKKNFPGYEIGFSDHSLGFEAALGAVALGAKVIEKHITLNKKMEGPDHSSSSEPKEFMRFIKGIRKLEQSLGHGRKVILNCELKNIRPARKSIVARTKIKKGERFTEKNITTKRPADGISAEKWENILGKKAKRNFDTDEKISL